MTMKAEMGWIVNSQTQTHCIPEIRPTEGSAMVSKAEGEKSRSVSAQPVQRSVTVTVTLLPWSAIMKLLSFSLCVHVIWHLQVALIFLLQTGLLLGSPAS